ncbi:hypothetical protein BDB01DRAFT_850016 [Pilobolus umbonatus]|nr:hypothetical protein BDB01DRAFT_850016 [Pilobolus umbonatus]
MDLGEFFMRQSDPNDGRIPLYATVEQLERYEMEFSESGKLSDAIEPFSIPSFEGQVPPVNNKAVVVSSKIAFLVDFYGEAKKFDQIFSTVIICNSKKHEDYLLHCFKGRDLNCTPLSKFYTEIDIFGAIICTRKKSDMKYPITESIPPLDLIFVLDSAIMPPRPLLQSFQGNSESTPPVLYLSVVGSPDSRLFEYSSERPSILWTLSTTSLRASRTEEIFGGTIQYLKSQENAEWCKYVAQDVFKWATCRPSKKYEFLAPTRKEKCFSYYNTPCVAIPRFRRNVSFGAKRSSRSPEPNPRRSPAVRRSPEVPSTKKASKREVPPRESKKNKRMNTDAAFNTQYTLNNILQNSIAQNQQLTNTEVAGIYTPPVMTWPSRGALNNRKASRPQPMSLSKNKTWTAPNKPGILGDPSTSVNGSSSMSGSSLHRPPTKSDSPSYASAGKDSTGAAPDTPLPAPTDTASTGSSSIYKFTFLDEFTDTLRKQLAAYNK